MRTIVTWLGNKNPTVDWDGDLPPIALGQQFAMEKASVTTVVTGSKIMLAYREGVPVATQFLEVAQLGRKS